MGPISPDLSTSSGVSGPARAVKGLERRGIDLVGMINTLDGALRLDTLFERKLTR